MLRSLHVAVDRAGIGIRQMDGKIYKVFVSSTYDDLREERAAVEKALLQLDCLPVGMELFPAADEETWDFIKSQIDDCDYYVVIVAGRYGSVAADGISFTEKEYDYAVSKRKPSIAFLHGFPGNISVDRSERTEERLAKLQTFISKIKKRPVRLFSNPHELALEVTTSFVKLIRERPSEGYVRSSQAVEYKRYAALLEELNDLREKLKQAEQFARASLFKGHDKVQQLQILLSRPVDKTEERRWLTAEVALGKVFQLVAEAILESDEESAVFLSVCTNLIRNVPESQGWSINGFAEESQARIRRELYQHELIEIKHEGRPGRDWLGNQTGEVIVGVWAITDYGRKQLRAMADE
jgi:Domain of unknown function (DUF4062)